MIVKSCNKEKNTVTFEVELTAAEFEAHVNAAFQKNRGRIMIPGFRKGKAPRALIENMYGADFFHNDAVDSAAPEAFDFAVKEKELQTVGRPALTDYKVAEDKSAVLTFQSDVWPEVTLGQYKGLEAEKTPVEVTEDEINAELERMRKQNARIITVERAAENGDTVNIDYVGTKDGVAFEGGSAEGYDLALGSGSFIPGFEEKLVGIKAGEEKDLELTFPEEYHAADLAGAAVVFHVKCNAVKAEELPEADDEFAKDNDFDTLAELKADISKRQTEKKENAAKNLFTDALVDQAAANMTVDVPASMVEERMDGILNEYAQFLSQSGMNINDYVKAIGTTPAEFRETTRATAEKQTRTDILLSAVADAEKIEVTDEDKMAEYKRMGEAYGIEPTDVEKYVNVEELVSELRRRKAMDFITENGVAVAPKAEKAE